MLISTIQGANVLAWFASWSHISRFTKTSRQQSLKVPKVVKHTVHTLGLLLSLSYLASGFDIWLHASSAAVLITVESPYASPGGAHLGKTINETRCEYYADNLPSLLESDPEIQKLCGLLVTLAPDSPIGIPDAWNSLPEGFRTLSNTSIGNSVVFTDDQHAILVNASNSLALNYEAYTVGVHVSCQRYANANGDSR